MFVEITYFPIFGKPFIMYLGILTLLAILITASVAVMNKKGIRIIPFRWHPVCAGCAILLALVHGLLGMLAYF
jgi:hypothetical protein